MKTPLFQGNSGVFLFSFRGQQGGAGGKGILIGFQDQLAVILPGGGPCGLEAHSVVDAGLGERYSPSSESKSTEANRAFSTPIYRYSPRMCMVTRSYLSAPRGLFVGLQGVFQQVHQQGARSLLGWKLGRQIYL